MMLHEVVQRFVEERLESEKTQSRRVFCFGMLIFVTGCGFLSLRPLLRDDSLMLHMTLRWLYGFFAAVGIIIISVCDMIDYDEIYASRPHYRSMFFLPIVLTLYIGYQHPPYILCLTTLPLLWLVFGGAKVHVHHTPRSTTLMMYAVLIYYISTCGVWVYNTISYESRHTDFLWYPRFLCGCIASLLFTSSVFIAMRAAYRKIFSRMKSRSVEFHYVCYDILLSFSLIWFFAGVFLLSTTHTIGRGSSLYRLQGLWDIGRGFVNCIPPSLVLFFGPDTVFGFMARQFDLSNAERDGIFLSELYIRDRDFVHGSLFWVHFEMLQNAQRKLKTQFREDGFEPNANPAFPEDDERHDYWEGVVTKVMEDNTGNRLIQVQIKECPKFSLVLRSGFSGDSVEKLLKMNPPRLIEWEALTFELMTSFTSTSASYDDLSRPLQTNETIDFFVSHSWRDNAVTKWNELSKLAEAFKERKGRYPTFWFDKFCICQGDGDPTGGLKCLCCYIVACDKMVVLCGRTYPHRIWCVWELFAMFAFQRENISQLVLIPLNEPGSSCTTPLEALEKFSVDNARCYSPNDEEKLLRIIDAVGRSEFNMKIQKMARLMMKKKTPQVHRDFFCFPSDSSSGSDRRSEWGKKLHIGKGVW